MVRRLRRAGSVRRASMLALIDATMSEIRHHDSDPEACTVFAGMADEMTEVNLDLHGALESVVEEESRVGSPVPLEFERIELAGPNTLSQRAPVSWVEDLLVKEEFSFDDDELPMLDSGEFLAVPRTDDLRIPSQVGRLNGRSLIAPEPKPLVSRLPLAKDLTLPVPVNAAIGGASLADTKAPKPPPAPSTWPWISAIVFWAATMLGAWAFRMQLFELMGLL